MLSVPFYMWKFYIKNKDIVPPNLSYAFKLVLIAQGIVLIAAPTLIILVLVLDL
jgi:hypothetical protein